MRLVDIGFDIDKVGPDEKTRAWMREVGFGDVFSQLLNQGISGQYPQGIPLGKGKILARVQVKLRDLPVGERIVEIEESEYDMLKGVFMNENTLFNWGQVQVATIYSEAIEKAEKKRSPADLRVADVEDAQAR